MPSEIHRKRTWAVVKGYFAYTKKKAAAIVSRNPTVLKRVLKQTFGGRRG